MATKKKKSKKKAVEMTLWGVVLSYPDLHDPKPYKGKVYYKTDCLLDLDHAQLGELRAAIKEVREESWGDDKTEWPEGASKVFIKNGDEREDQKGYAGKKYIQASTQTPVPVVDMKGKGFNAQAVKGGMTANVAIRISAWEFDGDEGMSIYLQGVQIDTSVPSLNFGGGKTVSQMFSKGGKADDAEDTEEDEEAEEDEEDEPRGKKSSKSKKDEDEDSDSDDEDSDEDEEDEKPKNKKKKAKKNFDDEEE